MSGNRASRKDYATGLIALFILGIILLPVGGVVILGLLTPFIIAGLLVMMVVLIFTGHRR